MNTLKRMMVALLALLPQPPSAQSTQSASLSAYYNYVLLQTNIIGHFSEGPDKIEYRGSRFVLVGRRDAE